MNDKWNNIRAELDDRLLVLAHYYQNDDVFNLADETGDSYRLAKLSAESKAEYTIFCGVKFMAESAAVLSKKENKVFTPVQEASCALADTMDYTSVKEIFDVMAEKMGHLPVPVVYVNSSAEIKALAGRHDGIACTSSNAGKIMKTLLDQGRQIFFMPDKNLGMNTALKLGISPNDTAVIKDKDNIDYAIQKKIILWDGFCYVHHLYTPEDIRRVRENFPGCRIILHPESRPEVVTMADYAGSTSGLLNEFQSADPGTVLVVGTEWNFVERLKKMRPEIQVEHLRPSICAEMHRIKKQNLLSLAENLLNGDEQTGRITVPEEISGDAASALNRMIRYTEGKEHL